MVAVSEKKNSEENDSWHKESIRAFHIKDNSLDVSMGYEIVSSFKNSDRNQPCSHKIKANIIKSANVLENKNAENARVNSMEHIKKKSQ